MGTIASERLKMSNLTNAPLFAHQRCSKQRHIGDTPLLCTLYHFIGGYFLAHCGGEFGIGSDEGRDDVPLGVEGAAATSPLH